MAQAIGIINNAAGNGSYINKLLHNLLFWLER